MVISATINDSLTVPSVTFRSKLHWSRYRAGIVDGRPIVAAQLFVMKQHFSKILRTWSVKNQRWKDNLLQMMQANISPQLNGLLICVSCHASFHIVYDSREADAQYRLLGTVACEQPTVNVVYRAVGLLFN
jgi:hypothetical protein